MSTKGQPPKGQPPRFVKPGDDPELDALLDELRRDGQSGDPLFPDAKAVREAAELEAARREAAEREAAQREAAQREGAEREAETREAARREAAEREDERRDDPVTERKTGARSRRQWLALGVLGAVAPLLAMALAALLREPVVEVQPVAVPAADTAGASTTAAGVRVAPGSAAAPEAAGDAGALEAGADGGAEDAGAKVQHPAKGGPAAPAADAGSGKADPGSDIW